MLKWLLMVVILSMASGVLAVQVGDKAPAISLPSLASGEMLRLDKYRGQVVYLDFWASWCAPCRQSLPMMNTLRNTYKDRGFEVLAVNLDEDPKEAKAFLKQYPVDYPVLADNKGIVLSAYPIQGMPSSFLIDRAGIVRQVHVGFKEADIVEIESDIKQLLMK